MVARLLHMGGYTWRSIFVGRVSRRQPVFVLHRAWYSPMAWLTKTLVHQRRFSSPSPGAPERAPNTAHVHHFYPPVCGSPRADGESVRPHGGCVRRRAVGRSADGEHEMHGKRKWRCRPNLRRMLAVPFGACSWVWLGVELASSRALFTGQQRSHEETLVYLCTGLRWCQTGKLLVVKLVIVLLGARADHDTRFAASSGVKN